MYYSQFGEDEHMYSKYFLEKKDGVFLELGAMNGVKFSNTKFFEDLGWTGYLIEPDPVTSKELSSNRPRSKCFNVAIAKESSDLKMRTMNVKPEDGRHAVTAVEDGMAKGYRDKWHKNSKLIVVPCCPISDLVKFEECPHIDFWSLDVEGKELDVLETFDWRIQVDYILIEMLDRFYKDVNDKCRELLKSKGYVLKEKVHFNEVWSKEPQ